MNFAKMNWNKYLMTSHMILGYYDVHRAQLTIDRSKLITSRIIRFVILLCAIKMVIIATNSRILNIKFYLIETQVLSESDQKIMDIGVAVIQIGFFFSFSYLMRLNQNIELLRSFNFLFVLNSKDLYQYYSQNYGLDRRSVEKFAARFNMFYPFLGPILIAYNGFFVFCILRCLYNSYYYVGPGYFPVALFLASITILTYVIMSFFFATGFMMVYLSAELAILRLKSINKTISKRFVQKAHLMSTADPIKVRKQRAGIQKIFESLNSFFTQFSEMNCILDSLLSQVIIGLYVGFYGFPYFIIFSEIPLGVRLFLCFLTALTSLLAFSIPLYNEQLKKEVS